MNCNWGITVPNGYSVKVVFSHFNIEKRYDYLRIYDGPSASSPLLMKLSGHFPTPFGVISTGSSLWLNFRTDFSISLPGFEANYTTVSSSIWGKSSDMYYIFGGTKLEVTLTENMNNFMARIREYLYSLYSLYSRSRRNLNR